MRYSLVILAPLFVMANVAPAIIARDDSQTRICPNLPVKDGGCIRYVRGFDVTGVTTEIDLTFPQIQSECDCIQACINRKGICNNYVWKFSTPASVISGYRTCTLYSDFNLPADVTIEFDADSKNNVNLQPLQPDNNPQAGSLTPQAFKDKNLNTTADNDAVSGPLWVLADGSIVC